MVVRVVVGGQHDQNRAAESAVDVIGDHTLKNSSLEDPIEPASIGIEVVAAPSGRLWHRPCAVRIRPALELHRRSHRLSSDIVGVAICESCIGSVAVDWCAAACGCAKSIATVSLLSASCCCFSRGKRLLLGLSLGLRDIRGLRGRIRAVAIDRRTLRGGHRRSPAASGPGTPCAA